MDGEHQQDPPEASDAAEREAETPAIDVAALAARVYRLMCAEVRQAQARGAGHFQRGM